MRALAAALLVTVAALFQLTQVGRFAAAGGAPSLVLVAVVCLAWLGGARAGLGSALGSGLLLDLGGQGPLGVHALALIPAAWLGTRGARHVGGGRLPAVAAVAALATIAYELVVGGFAETLGHAGLGLPGLLPALAGSCLWNALPAPAGLLLLERLERGLVAA